MAQMYTHELNPLKGWPSPAALDKRGELDTAVDTVGTVYAGMVVSKASNGKLIRGVPLALKASGFAPMPIFVFQNASDFDVTIDSTSLLGAPGTVNIVGVSSSDAGSTTAVSVRPILGGLVATGGYELQTTEFVGTPTTGQVLTSPTTAISSGDGGKLKVANNGSTVPAGTIIVAVVSDGVTSSDFIGGPNVLNFWPVYDVVWTTPT